MAETALPETIRKALDRWSGPILETIAEAVPRPATPGDGSMSDMLWYHLDTGGKRLRPLIVLMATEALGGDPEAALPFACGVELLHNATLVHDDYQDGDTVRRGEPTVWKRYGWEQSINAGDGLYFAGLGLVGATRVSDANLRRLLETTSRRLLQVITGQVDEFRLKTAFRPTEAEYIHVIRGKTAGLFALPLEGAAICAGLPDVEVARAAAVGDTLGLLFQVQDDLLDLLGGKGRELVGTDIAEGKPSLPVVHAVNEAPADVADRLAALVHKPRAETTPRDIAEAIGVLEQTGAIAYSLDRVRTWCGEVQSENPALSGILSDIVSALVAPIAQRL